MLKICCKCWHFTNRRGLFGLCYEPGRHLAGMRKRGHAPCKCARCPACDHFFFFEQQPRKRQGTGLSSLLPRLQPRRVVVRPRAQSQQRRTDKEV